MNATWKSIAGFVMTAALAVPALAEVLVQDIATLQGERINRLEGYGIVVGLNGTGDPKKNEPTWDALMGVHQRYAQTMLSPEQLATGNAALVNVIVETPAHGYRDGERVDVIVAAGGGAKSLDGGQLLTVPLLEAPITLATAGVDAAGDPRAVMQLIRALAGGRIEIPDPSNPARGVIRGGASMLEDYHENYIENGALTLVLNDKQAGFPMAQMIARAINQELTNPAGGGLYEKQEGKLVRRANVAVALNAKTVRVHIPTYELEQPANFISRVLQTPLFFMPKQQAKVVINRSTSAVTFTGTVTILPTVLKIPGGATLSVGSRQGGAAGATGLATEGAENAEFQDLLRSLEQLQLSPEQTVKVIEGLHEAGTLQAQLAYVD